jgi:hypothetical protein
MFLIALALLQRSAFNIMVIMRSCSAAWLISDISAAALVMVRCGVWQVFDPGVSPLLAEKRTHTYLPCTRNGI